MADAHSVLAPGSGNKSLHRRSSRADTWCDADWASFTKRCSTAGDAAQPFGIAILKSPLFNGTAVEKAHHHQKQSADQTSFRGSQAGKLGRRLPARSGARLRRHHRRYHPISDPAWRNGGSRMFIGSLSRDSVSQAAPVQSQRGCGRDGDPVRHSRLKRVLFGL